MSEAGVEHGVSTAAPVRAAFPAEAPLRERFSAPAVAAPRERTDETNQADPYEMSDAAPRVMRVETA